MKYLTALLAALLLAGCCSGTQEGMFFVGHAFCPSEWGMARRNSCVNECYQKGGAAASCEESCR